MIVFMLVDIFLSNFFPTGGSDSDSIQWILNMFQWKGGEKKKNRNEGGLVAGQQKNPLHLKTGKKNPAGTKASALAGPDLTRRWSPVRLCGLP